MKSIRHHDARRLLALAAAPTVLGAACLTRPVETSPPNLFTTFTTKVPNQAVDKVDLLFMIDNSSSMGDKQALLAQAIPDMIARLVTPHCVDKAGVFVGTSDQNGICAAGQPEFPPVHDMHIGVVSSSLGARGGNVCDPSMPNPANMALNAHQDDRGELIARGGPSEGAVPKAGALQFLAWFPDVPANKGRPTPPVPAETTAGDIGQAGTLIGDFASMIQGANEHGCGYEAQNEAWYRFLVQPDPYDQLAVQNRQVVLSGVDGTILKQRAAFLRPDSLLAVIVVTDENEQVANPYAVNRQSWLYETWPFQGASAAGMQAGAPEGTTACGSVSTSPGPNPGADDPACLSCGLNSVRGRTDFATICPADLPGGGDGFLDPNDDGELLRFFDERIRFGVTARYPVSRYFTGLTSTVVPSQDHETAGDGTYVGDQQQYENCINPIYAKDLPTDPTADLCHLALGPRTPDQVFYAAIAGVPHQLLQAAPGSSDCDAGTNAADCPQKSQLSDDDWRKIIGADPVHYDFSGMDFHMLESTLPRTDSPCPPGSSDDCDPINGREWDTKKRDLEYACTFPLVDPQTGAAQPKDCTLPQYTGACDCLPDAFDFGAPLCDKDAAGAYTTTQIMGKAYPSAREMQIAHAMATQVVTVAGPTVQGIVSSLCPIHTSQVGGPNDPLYGYRPAVNAIVDRLKKAFNVQCLPQSLIVQDDGTVPCLLLAPLGAPGDESVCNNPAAGLAEPPPDILARFRETQYEAYTAAGGAQAGLTDPRTVPICQLAQLPNNPADAAAEAKYQACKSESGGASGWCYVDGAAAGDCQQEILFTQGQPPPGSSVFLQCTEKAKSLVDSGT